MSTPVRVTAQIVGATVFNTSQATLEWTPQGTIRIVKAELGQQPVALFDGPPSALREVSNYTANQSMLVFKPVQGGSIKLSLLGSMIAPDPHESANDYAVRSATTGVPPQEWWASSLAASGVKVTTWGWGKTWAIAGGIVVGIAVIVTLAVLIGSL